MSDPYEQHPHIKFVAPYSIQECKRILGNCRKAPGEFSGGFDSSTSDDTTHKMTFKVQRTFKDKQGKPGSYYELNGTLTYLSNDETLVTAKFKFNLFPITLILILVVAESVLLITLPVLQKYKIVCMLLLGVLVIFVCIDTFVNWIALRNQLRYILDADKTPLRKAKDA